MLRSSPALSPHRSGEEAEASPIHGLLSWVGPSTLAILIVALMTMAEGSAFGQSITNKEIDAAIKAGLANTYDQLVSKCEASTGARGGYAAAFGGDIESLSAFDVTVAANAGQIALLAADAQHLYRTCTVTDVPDDLKHTAAVYVVTSPRRPAALFGRVVSATPIERIVLKSRTQLDRVVEPSLKNALVTFNGRNGGTIESTRGLATFPGATPMKLPRGDFDVVIGEAFQENAPSKPPATARPRIDAWAGLTIVSVRAVAACVDAGCLAAPANLDALLSWLVSAGYFWTPRLLTQIEIVSSAGTVDWDYAIERVVPRPGADPKGITLKHNYGGDRRTIAQIVQFGRGFRPYFGAGVGIESQTTYDSWLFSSVVGELKTVNEFPKDGLPKTETNHAIVFGQAGMKAFLGRHAYFRIDGKFTNRATAFVSFGFGVELP